MKKTLTFPGEAELIARYFAPLAKGFPGAYGLLDDAAVIAPLPGHDLVAKTDAIVGGVHFLPNDPPDLIAYKVSRVNLSDLAAKGAVPRAYMLDITGGDDHEILFTAPPAALDELTTLSQPLDVPITAIGRMEPPSHGRKTRVAVLDEFGELLAFDRGGWTHS